MRWRTAYGMRARAGVRLALLAIGLGVACLAPARMAQLPLLQPAVVNELPNLVLTVDDSASMGRRYLPDAASPQRDGPQVFHPLDTALPDARGEDASREGEVHTWTTRADDRWSARMRFHGHNRLYYDPSVRYRPWSRADGTLLPDADPAAAWLDPVAGRAAGVLDLTGEGVWPGAAVWCHDVPAPGAGALCESVANERFAPATFYVWQGDPAAPDAVFERFRIMDAPGHARPATRTDCAARAAGVWCSQQDEYRNFANWFSYHRTRLHVAIAALSHALARQEAVLRLGYGRVGHAQPLPVDGQLTSTLMRGVRPFSGADRAEVFDWLHRLRPGGPSPLRRALDDIGRYYERSAAADAGSPWSETPGLGVPSRHSPCRRSYHLLVSDGGWNGEPAASVAARGNVDGEDGPVIEHADGRRWRYRAGPPWRDAQAGTLADVALHYFARDLHPGLPNALAPRHDGDAFWQAMVTMVVGFGGAGLLDPERDLDRLIRGELVWPLPQPGAPSTIDDLWHAALNGGGRYFDALDPMVLSEALSTALRDVRPMRVSSAGVASSDAQVYVPSYQTHAWSGELEAHALGDAGRSRDPVWRASERVPPHAQRNIWTWHPVARQALAFSADVLARASLPAWRGDAALVDYLRGDRSREGTPARRVRDGVLGDIVHSQPRVVAQADDLQYQFLPAGMPGRESYRAFVRDSASRTGHVFFGANDGMLHAVREVDGVETFAFVPAAVHGLLDLLAQPAYGHRFYVDGPLTEAQGWWEGRWRSVLLASAGAGAPSVMAVDVTDTSALGGHSVLWEYGLHDDDRLGHVLAAPDTGVTRGGQWIAAFGNGYDSADGEARLIVLDLRTGRLVRSLRADAGAGNGLGGVRLVRDSNQMVVAAYAGDLRGRVWRFDLRAVDPAEWRVDFDGLPWFEARDARGQPQPVTAAPEYVEHPQGGQLVLLGTGRLHDDADALDTQTQSLSGLWDRVPATRAGRADERLGAQPALALHVLVPLESAGGSGTAASGGRHERLETTPVDWRVHRGWHIDLPRRLRDIHGARFAHGLAHFRVVAPASPDALHCGATEPEGLDLYLRALTGTMPPVALFDTNADGLIDSLDTVVAGIRAAGEAPARQWLDSAGRARLLGSGATAPVLDAAAMRPPRRWRQLVNAPH